MIFKDNQNKFCFDRILFGPVLAVRPHNGGTF